ncbi:oligosaccharide flippase family protein [Humibacillus xanthopallidus]|uniref:oligosaccharide flippase family protein n=1 Tax=Humibacillus xanthopallidus TaxID=412689 RepID=UPI0038508F8C
MKDAEPRATAPAVAPSPHAAIRGSSLLLVGRLLAIGAGILIQVLIVRYLPQAAFGAFSYCIAVVTLLTVVVSLGMEQTMSRFLAIYDERGQRAHLAGAILFYLAVVVTLGTVVVAATVLGRDELTRMVIHDRQSAELLAVMVLLAPLQAVDTLGSTLFAVYGRPGAIFWRRYVITPLLRIAVVAVMLVMQASVLVLGVGYVIATVVGLLIYLPQLWRLLRQRGVVARAVRPVMPVRALMLFTGSAVAADLLAIVLFASDAVIVGWISGATEVALLQATQPLASGNLVIFYALIPLFIPTASRFFASGETARGEELYASCSLWIAVFTFPIAALTIVCAPTLTETLFGQRYAAAGPILAIMATGQYLLAIFGLSGLTLKAHGILRNLALANVAVTVLNISANVLLVRQFGALGAAIGTTSTIALLTVGKLLIVRHDLGIWPVDLRLARALARIVGLGGILALTTAALDPTLAVDVALVGAATLLLLWSSRRDLRVLAVFPEAARVRVVRLLLDVR